MIVPMKKVNLLLLDKYREEALFDLRRLELLHIKYIKFPTSSDIDSLEQKIGDVEKALLIISENSPGDRTEKQIEEEAVALCVDQAISANIEKENHFKSKADIKDKISWYQDWGEFSLGSLKELVQEGVYIRLYKCNKRQLAALRKTKVVEVIKKQANNYYIAIVSSAAKEEINLKEIILPDQDIETLRKKLQAAENKMSSIDNLLRETASYKKSMFNYLNKLKKSLDFNRVKSSMQEEGEISYLQGFMPADAVVELVALANKKGWAYLIQEPDNLQEVPTFIKNPRWLRIIEPVFKFMGTLPGYNEYDISFSFLLFFSLFFALLIGDGGYGLIFLLITYLIRRKIPALPPEPFRLMYVLGFATIIWGAVSGTWFGFERIAQLPLLNSLIVDKVDSFVAGNQPFMMQMCFLIGAVHLTIAHSTIALRIINSLKAIAQLGWILIIWSVFFIAGKFVLGNSLPGPVGVMFSLGLGLVLLFSAPQRNILKGVATTLGDLPLKVISSFSDIISYLRLFAVGYASVAVASSFNNLALMIGFNNILRSLVSTTIITLGHGLNIILGLMAVIVHGIRLNMLEFSSHLDMQWSGIEYRPFKE